ncbi:MAG: hypothetical protein NVSMB42_16840 [Herpetosiphon sp.]
MDARTMGSKDAGRFWRRGIVLVMVGLIVIVASTKAGVAQASNVAGQRIAIPSYFYPGRYWQQLNAAAAVVKLAIINPNSGPGSELNTDYRMQVKQSQAAGVEIVGYVDTAYGKRLLIDVVAEIDRYYSWYGIDGIFLDQVSTDCQQQPYFLALHDYIKAKGRGARVILNPGTQTSECYMTAGDIVVTFEGTYGSYRTTYLPASWTSSYPAERFWHLIYGTTKIEEMAQAVVLSKQRGAGWVYVTPDTLPNPWGTLPVEPYWSAEVALVQYLRID